MDDRTYLLHVQDAIAQILSYTSSGEAGFRVNRQVQDAVIRNFEIIGEAVKHISDDLRRQHPNVPWKQIAGMRDEMIHEYFGVDLTIVWDTVQNDLAKLKQTVDRLLMEHES